MLPIVCWKWDPPEGIHPKKGIVFTAQHVNILKNMLERNLQIEHELVCITDNPEGIDPSVRIVRLWNDYQDLGGCYRRLRIFSEEMEFLIGKRFASIDLDVVIVQDVTNIFDCADDFKIWGDTHITTPYNGSLFIMNAGARSIVWKQFSRNCRGVGRSHGFVGTDQAWIGACLGKTEPKWTTDDGVFSYRIHYQKPRQIDLHPHTRMVFFHGSSDPSQLSIQNKYQWVREHWR